MKLLNISFFAIPAAEFDFLAYRHSIDSKLFCTMHGEFHIEHLKLAARGYTPVSARGDELFFEGSRRFFHIPYRLCRYVRKQRPEVVIVHGFLFPFQVIVLKLFMHRSTRLIVQHHAEQPFRNGFKRWLQQLAYEEADACFFSSRALADPFIAQGIIRSGQNIFEIPESSTTFVQRNRQVARAELGLSAEALLFLWVGRLDRNKDPLTVLRGFDAYVRQYSEAKLYMCYHEADDLQAVRDFVNTHQLKDAVQLVGQVAHAQLEAWYSACDFFISGSHYESTGYALCEAMACGCIPVVTNIAAFNTISHYGDYAILFRPGDAGDLFDKLNSLQHLQLETFRQKIIAHFKNELSFEALSGKIELAIMRSLQK